MYIYIIYSNMYTITSHVKYHHPVNRLFSPLWTVPPYKGDGGPTSGGSNGVLGYPTGSLPDFAVGLFFFALLFVLLLPVATGGGLDNAEEDFWLSEVAVFGLLEKLQRSWCPIVRIEVAVPNTWESNWNCCGCSWHKTWGTAAV